MEKDGFPPFSLPPTSALISYFMERAYLPPPPRVEVFEVVDVDLLLLSGLLVVVALGLVAKKEKKEKCGRCKLCIGRAFAVLPGEGLIRSLALYLDPWVP